MRTHLRSATQTNTKQSTQPLAQIRPDIKQGGFGLTSQMLAAPAALLVAIREFQEWLAKIPLDFLWLFSGSTLQFFS